jgi:hypothetical protein
MDTQRFEAILRSLTDPGAASCAAPACRDDTRYGRGRDLASRRQEAWQREEERPRWRTGLSPVPSAAVRDRLQGQGLRTRWLRGHLRHVQRWHLSQRDL